jgi:acetyltransferase
MAGHEITFRSIQPEDESSLIEFHNGLSDQSVHFRYFGAVTLRERTLHERLRRHCAIDYTREFALVAEQSDPNGRRHILGVARLFKEPASCDAEFAILISDAWQGKGLGTQLLKLLVRVGRESHLRRIIGHILGDNTAMTRVSRKAGFSVHLDPSIGEWLAEIEL